MAQNTLNFTINLGGTAYTGIAQIDKAQGKLVQIDQSATNASQSMTKLTASVAKIP